MTPKGVIIISHGMSEHINRYQWLISKLNDDGYHVMARDHRGHGVNIINGSRPGYFADSDGWNLVNYDLKKTLDESKDLYPNLKHFLFAHSMGSWIGLSLLNKKLDLDGIVISGSSKIPISTIYLQKLLLKVEIIRKGPEAVSNILDSLTLRKFNESFAPNRTPNDWISGDELNVDEYTADPLCGFLVTNKLWEDLANGLLTVFSKKNYSPDNKSIPVMILSGEFDAASSNGKLAKKLYDFLSNFFTNISFKLIKNARHEIFSDLNKDSSYNALRLFINKKV
tara:strand:- start:1475 stop:2320 length:846 start_codon:yes stop_codon:yes gene_type:complete